MNKRLTWTVLIYTLVLVVISLIMALVILWIAGVLSSNLQIQEITRKLWNNVVSKWNLAIKYSQIVNSNGSGFIDNIGCPTSVTMSGTTVISTTNPTLQFLSGDFYCSGTHDSNEYRIYVSSWAFDDTTAQYEWDEIDIVSGVPNRNFSDPDNTRMTFNIASTAYADGIDDDFNSDNYKESSTWAIAYASWYTDDDTDSRQLIYGYANSWVGFVNMMWTNTKATNYISSNANNTWGLFETMEHMTSSWVAFLDINQDYKMKLYVFDKAVHDATKELISIQSYESNDNLWGLGYLQDNSWVLDLSFTKTGNEFEFDFNTNDYALFIRNNGTGTLLYNISVETLSWTGVYINPIDDSAASVIKVLANDIIIDNEWRFLYDQFEVIGFK